MKKIESLKRIIILQLSLIGIIIDTAIYAFFWLDMYYPVLSRRARGLNYYFRDLFCPDTVFYEHFRRTEGRLLKAR